MARLDPGASARWLSRRAKQAASSLKAEYEAGTRGDESPTQPIYPTPSEQLAAVTSLLAGTRGGRADAVPADEVARSAGDDERDAAEVAAAMRSVDWQQVKAATSERSGAAADAMRTMAREVDWAKVQPVAATVSSALIAAVASGRLPLAGRMGPLVAKALSDHGVLAQRVAASFADDDTGLPPDFLAEVGPGAAGSGGAAHAPTAPLPQWRGQG